MGVEKVVMENTSSRSFAVKWSRKVGWWLKRARADAFKA